ncbi:unnamed protein product [Calypogeia fissa]
MSLASILDGALIRPGLEGAPSEVDGGCFQQPVVADTVKYSGGVASSGKMQQSSTYGHETRSAFRYESKRASFDSKRQSVHAALEIYGLNCPVPVSPSPMQSKSALGRDLIPHTTRPLLFSGNDGQVDSLFDHDTEHFKFQEEVEYRDLTHEVQTENVLSSKGQPQVSNPEERKKGDIHIHSDLFYTSDNEGVAAIRPIEEISKADVEEAESLLEKLKVTAHWPDGKASRGIFCSRTLSLQSINTIGYDMDYTLIHYNIDAWEGRAYDYGVAQLRKMGYPSDGLKFDSSLVL